MHKPAFFKSMLNSIAKAYGEHPGKMLVHTGVIGWLLSSAAQVCAIVINDKIPKEQKMFMIPQEVADAAVNIASFYLITQSVKSVALKLVNSGRLLPKAVKDFLTHKGVAEKLGKAGFDVYESKLLTPSGIKRLNSFKNGVDVIATTIGSIVSCNIVTPVIRNQIAAHRQKKNIERMNNPYKDAASQIDNKIFNKIYSDRPSMVGFQSKAYSRALPTSVGGNMTV